MTDLNGAETGTSEQKPTQSVRWLKMVVHEDDAVIADVSLVLPERADLLDLMVSSRDHLLTTIHLLGKPSELLTDSTGDFILSVLNALDVVTSSPTTTKTTSQRQPAHANYV